MKPDKNPISSTKLVINIWILFAFVLTTLGFLILESDFPLFIYINLILSFIIINKINDVNQFSSNWLSINNFIKYSFMNLFGILVIYFIFEPWSHTYQKLLTASLENGVDVTFGWIQKYNNSFGFLLIFLFSLFVSIFSEELMFRGVLEGYLFQKTTPIKGIIIQALIFSIPQCLILIVLPLANGLLYIIFYNFIAIGLLNGLIVYKSHSIFPSILSASIANILMVLIYL